MARFLERRKHHRVTDLLGALNTRVRTDPAVTNNVRIADNRTLPDNAERKRGLFAVRLELLRERRSDIGLRLVEKLQVHQLCIDFGEHENAATAHLVTHVHRVADHVANLSATHDRTHVLHHRAAAHQNVAEHGYLVHECIFYEAVMHQAVVNARRERHVARQEKRSEKARQIDLAHERAPNNAVRIEVVFDHDLRPRLGTVTVAFENLDLGLGQWTVFGH